MWNSRSSGRAAGLVVGALLAGLSGCGATEEPSAQRLQRRAQAVGPASLNALADFTIERVKGPPSAYPWGNFTVEVKLCNRGTQVGYTGFSLYLSDDAVITPMDVNIGVDFAYVEPGQCSRHEVAVSLPYSYPGTYTLGAIADPGNQDPELNENNNSLAGTRLDVGYAADFTVTATAAPHHVTPGGGIQATVTLCNQGTQLESAQARLVLSTDSEFSATDVVVGDATVNYLDGATCAVRTLSGNITVPAGVYYLGVIADPQDLTQEFLESNNTYSLGQFGVGLLPDFVATEVTAPTSLEPGDPFTVTVRVCNQGTQGGNVDVRLSLAQTPQSAPMLPALGQAPATYVNAGQCVTRSISGTTPYLDDAGYFLVAQVDPGQAVAEFLEGNNTHSTTRMGVGYPQDFTITQVAAPLSRPNWGDSFPAQVTTCNQGQEAASANVSVVLSSDEEFTLSDWIVGSSAVFIEPGECITEEIEAYAYEYGTKHLGAIVTVAANGSIEFFYDNNTADGGFFSQGFQSDFTVGSVTAPASVQAEQEFMADVTVCNQGTDMGIGSTHVALYLSRDTVITKADIPIGELQVDNVGAGQCVTVSVPVYPWVYEPGGWYIGAIVDPHEWNWEFLEHNNTGSAAPIQVLSP